MARCVVWVEGVDFDETLFDTQKLSVIRGASRALEEMPGVASGHFKQAHGASRVHRITAGASQAGFIVEVDAAEAQATLDNLMARLRAQGREPKHVAPVATDPNAALESCAPFAHLRFHGFVEPIGAGEDAVDAALQRARARVRVEQLRDPGVRVVFLPREEVNDRPCEYDRVRPAEVRVDGVPKSDGQDSFEYQVSRASAARWHFGRALRQRLYEDSGVSLPAEYAFADDLHELTATDRPKVQGKNLPPAARRKIAVFAADGDAFTKLRQSLNAKLGDQIGLTTLALTLETRMRTLLTELVDGLLAMETADGCGNAAAARFFDGEDPARSTLKQRQSGVKKLLRFETLLFGGDDAMFVVPAWLGWWLALRFFEITSDWAVGADDIRAACKVCNADVPQSVDEMRFPMRFSAGMVFCSRKTPIRAAKKLADELCRVAKTLKSEPGGDPAAAGGLEIEALESVEPPFDGLGGLRNRLLGENWREGGNGPSRLTLPRSAIRSTYSKLHELWIGDVAFPASQAFGALRAATADDEMSSPAADEAAQKALNGYFDGAGGKFERSLFKLLPRAVARDKAALNLYFALQMRDYVKAAGSWTDKAAGLCAGSPGRVGTVRARNGGLHGCQTGKHRAVRGGPRRHAVPG